MEALDIDVAGAIDDAANAGATGSNEVDDDIQDRLDVAEGRLEEAHCLAVSASEQSQAIKD